MTSLDGAPDGEFVDARARARERAAVVAWVERGSLAPLVRWLDGLLDAHGIPRRLPVAAWAELLAVLDEARRGRPQGWPEALDARVEALLVATLRFARAGGAAVFTPTPARPDEALPEVFRGWAERLTEPGLTTVLDWWFPRRSASRRARGHAPPPLPAWSSSESPLAILRADWSAQSDFLAVDHRRPGPGALVELTGLGQVWLGPVWESSQLDSGATAPHGAPQRPRMRLWVSNSAADLAEWSFRVGRTRVTRTALLLRGRRIALLAEQVEQTPGDGGSGDGAGWQVALPSGITAAPLEQTTGWRLASRRKSPQARLVPLALPCRRGASERGSFTLEGRALRISQARQGRCTWLPLLASWDPLRNRKAVRWRVLTVGENSRTCPPDRAFAARITWGRDETLLIYRSLGAPALRSVLGYPTRARFLVALFDRDGTVTPIVTVD
jgi:hypothetical protein